MRNRTRHTPRSGLLGKLFLLTFYLNPYVFPRFKLGDCGELTFPGCWRYRLGETNDEGWWRKQCRFSSIAPEWGEFNEVTGDLRLDRITGPMLVAFRQIRQRTIRAIFSFTSGTRHLNAMLPAGVSERFRPLMMRTASWQRVSLPSRSSILMVPPRSGSIDRQPTFLSTKAGYQVGSLQSGEPSTSGCRGF